LVITLEEGADLLDYVPTEAKKLLDGVYGDHVHDNDGLQLDRGVDEDKLFQRYWRQVASISPVLYAVPQSGRQTIPIRPNNVTPGGAPAAATATRKK
jgi:hypothetical protein